MFYNTFLNYTELNDILIYFILKHDPCGIEKGVLASPMPVTIPLNDLLFGAMISSWI